MFDVSSAFEHVTFLFRLTFATKCGQFFYYSEFLPSTETKKQQSFNQTDNNHNFTFMFNPLIGESTVEPSGHVGEI